MKSEVFTALKSKSRSTCLINFFLAGTLCAVFVAGVLFGPLFTARAKVPCVTDKGSSKDDSESRLNKVRLEKNEAVATNEQQTACMTEDTLKALLQNSTETLGHSLKDVVQRKIRFLAKTLWGKPNIRPLKKLHKGKANLEDDYKDSVLIHLITTQINQKLEKLLADNLEKLLTKAVRKLLPKASPVQQTTVATVPTESKALDMVVAVNRDRGSEGCPAKDWSTYQGSCYKVYNAHAFQWNIAHQACRRKEADLVVISSPEENQFVYSLVRAKAPTRKYLWLGLLRGSWNEAFFWVDRTPMFYSNWAQNEPNNRNTHGENCVHMYVGSGSKAMKWNDELCVNPTTGPMAYMCEKKVRGYSTEDNAPIWIEQDGSADGSSSGSGDDSSLAL